MIDRDKLFLDYFSHNSHIPLWDRYWYKLQKLLLPKMEEMENKLSIVIQGPLNERSIKTIPNYLRYGEVIVSHWNGDEENKKKLLDPYKEHIKIIENNYSDVNKFPSKPGSQAPWIFQHHTTLNGLRASTGNLAIKVRSDESFPFLDPIILKLRENRDTYNPAVKDYNWHKIVTSNIYFRYDREKKFHPSDHIIAGNKRRMIAVFERAERLCKLKLDIKFPEQLLCKCIIETYFDKKNKKRDKLDPGKSRELMKKHFDIIRISSLPKHIWTSSYRKYDALYSEEDWCHDINKI
tara:strand:+ start:731 stop:1609 length:879 start_codon:yes stop_codon:yes gene_type:complete